MRQEGGKSLVFLINFMNSQTINILTYYSIILTIAQKDVWIVFSSHQT